MVDQQKIERLSDIANVLRILSVQMTNASKSGHPTSCSSMAEIMSVLFFHKMNYSITEPLSPSDDRLVLSKGHAAPILYAAWAKAGLFPESELMKLRKIDNDLEGHPTPRLNFIDVATGSLGQGLSVAAGMAYMAKYIDKVDAKVYCIMGDSEVAEGSVWEAMSFASYYKLDNLCAIIDVNRLGQTQATQLEHDLETYQKRAEAFGFHTVSCDGHDVKSLLNAFDNVSTGKPQCVLAKTLKGKNFLEAENKDGFHGTALGERAERVIEHLKKLMKDQSLMTQTYTIPHKTKIPAPAVSLKAALSEPPNYTIGQMLATRFVYGTALVKLQNPRVFALDAETKNSTFALTYKNAKPENFIECFIAEQNLAGVAIGIGARGRGIPFISTFSCFLSRAFDQLRVAGISQSNLKCVGSHCGVSIGEDGPSQMGLEDIAMFRTLPNCNVFYPADAVSMERACELAAQHVGLDFIRTSRPATPVIYSNDTVFAVGKAHVVRKSDSDKVLVIGAGITLFESCKAAETLQQQGKNIRVLDPFTIKPLDSEAIIANANACGGKVIVVEDHYAQGGIGEAVASTLVGLPVTLECLCVREIPRSGPPQALLEKYGIDSNAIIKAVNAMV